LGGSNGIADFRLPIADWQAEFNGKLLTIGNWQLEIDND
jgi:hypothetical protein